MAARSGEVKAHGGGEHTAAAGHTMLQTVVHTVVEGPTATAGYTAVAGHLSVFLSLTPGKWII